MLVAEVVVVGVFLAALLTVIACFGYLVYATILEEHLLRSRQRAVRDTAGAGRWHPAQGRTALPMGRR
jgi:hypothetical protein